MKKNEAPAKTILTLMEIFKEALFVNFQRKDEKFEIKNYFKNIVDDNISLFKEDLMELERFLKSLNYVDDSKNDFMIKLLMENVKTLQSENNKLTQEIKCLNTKTQEMTEKFEAKCKDLKKANDMIIDELGQIRLLMENVRTLQSENNKLTQEIKCLNTKTQEMTEKFEAKCKDLEKANDMIIDELGQIIGLNNLKCKNLKIPVYKFLTENFQEFSEREIVFDSEKDDKSKMNEKIEGKSNLVIIVENSIDSLIFGAYYSIPFPKMVSSDQYYKDDKACLFNALLNKIYKADTSKNQHLRTYSGYDFMFGNTAKGDGVYIHKNWDLYFGTKTSQFEGESNFWGEAKKVKVKRMIIFQLK